MAGADDAVMLDSRGFIAETNATHNFMVLFRVTGQACQARVDARRSASTSTLATPTTAACPERGSPARLCRGSPRSAGLACAEGDYTLTAAVQRG